MSLLSRSIQIVGLVLIVCCVGCTSSYSAYSGEVKQALKEAGGNRAELIKVLKHYSAEGDEQKFKAAEFLIANMPGHGYVAAALFDKDKNEIEYDAPGYGTFEKAQAALDKIEKEHGEVQFKRKEFIKDLDVITADYLIENIDLAFKAWNERPWGKGLTFEAFCEHILPYRCSNEPINSWRGECMERYDDVAGKLDDKMNVKAAEKLISQDVHKWVRFDSVYYMHPTDQGFDEMKRTGMGRCEDISNMISYATRANCLAVASDYTPAWANRDNNHAWTTILDANGRGNAPLHNVPAKIYRKMFSIQRDCLALRKKKNEDLPRWLGGKNYIDVTEQYIDTSDVTVELVTDVPKKSSFAYLCVFNGGEWAPIAAGDIAGEKVTFKEIGRGIVYLPVYFVDKEIAPAAEAFTLDKAGKVHVLDGLEDSASPLQFAITTTKMATGDDDTNINIPQMRVKAGKSYGMSYWDGEWKSLGKKTTAKESVMFDSIPPNRLYWVIDEDGRKLERIFTIEQAKQKIW